MEEREFTYSGAANVDGTVDAGLDDETVSTLRLLIRELHEEGEISESARDEILHFLD
jgi:hypothetical protein